MSGQFNAIVAITLAYEGGGLDLDPHDRGNWTSGQIGVGELRGSRWGFSAAEWPALDITNLTRDQATVLYRAHYYDPIRCDDLPAPLALLAFDAAVNSGISASIMWLQMSIGATPDGIIGPKTLAAAATSNIDSTISEMIARRIADVSQSAIWKDDALGLARRFTRVCLQAKVLQGAAP